MIILYKMFKLQKNRQKTKNVLEKTAKYEIIYIVYFSLYISQKFSIYVDKEINV